MYRLVYPRLHLPSRYWLWFCRFSRLSGVWQWGRWPPLSASEVGTDACVTIFTVCVLSSEKCAHFSHAYGGILIIMITQKHEPQWLLNEWFAYSKSSVFETRLVVFLLQTFDLSCPDEWVNLCVPTKWKFIGATSWWRCLHSLRLDGIFQIPHANIADIRWQRYRNVKKTEQNRSLSENV